ncbi:aspartate--tRNA ligase [Blattabacterium cuenoti]|uniref:aspartate--tRNA ligase n=1 Tax=Blattabacterium cuenoti TaxID=1653831 RepID=UPI00163B8D82|nr:aspartate--tRNA ligase [Blattabacterium cuenoti]
MYRTHNCGELCNKYLNQDVTLSGWIHQIRNFGSIFFVDIRDFFGITQLIISKKILHTDFFLRKEYLIQVKGKVLKRLSRNYNLYTGEIEILVSKIDILNKSLLPPFSIEDNTDGKEIDRMRYRYLDIRRNPIKNNLIIRHNLMLEVRNFLSQKGFLEIETPILVNYTPEGSRSFLVPSRIHMGKFYALHQSPQIFKQLLMIGGIDKYFQIVKCFRDEDSRSDRQIEFTQIDCEMSFVKVHDVLVFFESFIKHIFKTIKNYEWKKKIPIISYCDAIKMYGSNNPDIRFGMKFVKLNHIVKENNINFLKSKKLVIGIKIKNIDDIDNNLINFLLKKINKKNNFFWIKCLIENQILSSNNVQINQNFSKFLIKYFKANPGDLLFVSYGEKKDSRKLLSEIRIEIIKKLSLKNKNNYEPLWIIDIPLFKWEKKEKRFKSVHHPFTKPKDEDLHFLSINPKKVRSQSYDLVINGMEIGSGSIRIHNKKIQNLIFQHLGFSLKEIKSNFGFFTHAFEYGAPPHGGIAFGLDRLISILLGGENIKNFIAFPKNNEGEDVMTNSPTFFNNNIYN